MIIIAAPAMGKSTLALDFARGRGDQGAEPTIFFSLEMGRSEIAMRLMSAEGAIPLQSMRKGTLDSATGRRSRRPAVASTTRRSTSTTART
jgi:replicative DNA helicase